MTATEHSQSPTGATTKGRDDGAGARPAAAAAPSVALPSASAIVLAAGLSTRMGRPKPLLPWGGRALVTFVVDALVQAGIDEIVVVTGYEAGAVEQALRGSRARAVFNERFADGRAGSVRVGARAVRGTGDILILNVDQPRPAALVRAILDAHRRSGAAITVPSFHGKRGHPAIFARTLLMELREVDEASEGLRAVMRRHAANVHEEPVADARALLDLNTPAAYAEALGAFGLSGETADP